MNDREAIKALTDGTNLDDTKAAQLASLSGTLLLVPLTCVVPPPKPSVVGGGGTGPTPPAPHALTAAAASADCPPMVEAITADNLVSFIAANGKIPPELAARVLEVVLKFIAAEGARALKSFHESHGKPR